MNRIKSIFYFLFILLISGCAVPHHYYNQDKERIKKSKYNKLKDHRVNLDVTTDYDTLIISRLYDRRLFGKLNKEQLQKVRLDMEKSLSVTLDFSEDLLVGYFSEKQSYGEDCFAAYLNNRRFDFSDKGNYIKVVKAEVTTYEVKDPYYIDRDKIFSANFFTEGVACDNWMVLRPDGTYGIYYAEGGNAIFWDLDEEWDLDFIKKNSRK